MEDQLSRTIRRKSETWMLRRYVDDDLLVIDGILKSFSPRFGDYFTVWPSSYRFLTPDQYIGRRKAWLHGDASRGWNAPSSFRRDLNRQHRSEMNHRLRIAIKNGYEEELILDKAIRNASWYWF